MSLPEYPVTRREQYLSAIAGENTALPDHPVTREEQYLEYIAQNGGGGGSAEIIAPDYSDLTFPVTQGKRCTHGGKLYEANQTISTSEAWTAAHWDETDVDEQLTELSQGIVWLGTSKQDKPVSESYTIATADWTALSGASPFTYQATVTAVHTIGQNTVVELLNDNAVLFATHGFAIGAVSGQSITVYSIGQPSASVTLGVDFYG